MKKLKSELLKFVLPSGKFSHNKALAYARKNNDFKQQVINRTSYLKEDVKFSERCFNIINEISKLNVCDVCGTNTEKYTSRGYNKTCSTKCHHILKALNSSKTMIKNGTYKQLGKQHKIRMADPFMKNKHSLSISKSLNSVDEKGKLRKNKAAESLKATLKNKPEIIKSRCLKQRESMEQLGYWLPLASLPAATKYRSEVHRITMKQPLNSLSNFHKRGPSTSFISDNHHIDHIYSVSDGFKNNIPAEIIGNIVNLRMIHHRDNVIKNGKSDISLEELMKLFKK
jgi:hypothetical protein